MDFWIQVFQLDLNFRCHNTELLITMLTPTINDYAERQTFSALNSNCDLMNIVPSYSKVVHSQASPEFSKLPMPLFQYQCISNWILNKYPMQFWKCSWLEWGLCDSRIRNRNLPCVPDNLPEFKVLKILT